MSVNGIGNLACGNKLSQLKAAFQIFGYYPFIVKEMISHDWERGFLQKAGMGFLARWQ
jgi:hypothetical protein